MNVRAVARGWWLVALTAFLAATAAYLYSLTVPDRFQARGTYVIGPSDSLDEPEAIVRSFDSLQRQGIVPTLVELLSSSTITEKVGASFGLDRTALMQYELRASVLSSSNTLELTATGPDARLTAELARGVGARASAVFEDLYSVYEIRPLDLPTTPDERFSPQPARNSLLAVMLGVTAGFGLALLRARYVEAPDDVLDGEAWVTQEAPGHGTTGLAAPAPVQWALAASPPSPAVSNNPGPMDPGPRDPGLAEPAPAEPPPAEPAPAEPAPAEPAPAEPPPAEPAPAEPAPAEPAPAEPAPAEPAPAEPAPAEPAPAEPAPAEPAPAEPGPTALGWPAEQDPAPGARSGAAADAGRDPLSGPLPTSGFAGRLTATVTQGMVSPTSLPGSGFPAVPPSASPGRPSAGGSDGPFVRRPSGDDERI